MAKGKFNNSQAGFAAVDTKKILSDLSKMADTDKVTVVSEKRAGKTIIGVEKTPVEFDADGKAEVTVKEARYFLTVPGFELDGAAEANADGDSKKDSDDKSEETKDTEESDGGEKAAETNADAKKAAKGNK